MFKKVRDTHRAVRQEDAIRIHLQDFAGGVVSWDDRDLAPKRGKPPQDVVLDPKVVCHNLHSAHHFFRSQERRALPLPGYA